MRLSIVILIVSCFLTFSSVLAYRQHYHEKTRFDRSIKDDFQRRSQGLVQKKQRIFTDTATQFTAYKDGVQSICYLEKMKNNNLDNVNLMWRDVIRGNKKTPHTSERTLTKIEAWRLAGGKIIDFCRGMKLILLQDTNPIPDNHDDPYYNELTKNEDEVIQKRVSDLVLMRPLLGKYTIPIHRRKRAAMPRFRGQTQSQWQHGGTDVQKEGKAEAEATQHSSRAVVSGHSGMGQAQSMSSGSDGCDGCPGYDRIGSVPGSIPSILGSQQNLPTGVKGQLR